MIKYLSTLHQRPHHHKKRFAFLASAGVTLIIFAIWALVSFGLRPDNKVTTANAAPNTEVTVNPFGSLTRGVAASFKALFGGNTNTKELKKGLEVIDSNSTK